MSRPDYIRTASTNLSGSTPRPLEGKLAIVTGGSRGIGAATVKNLAAKGCSVVVNYTSETSAEKVATLVSEIESTYGVTALAAQADMGAENGPAHLVTLTKNHFSHPKTGKFQIDIIINNAGLAFNQTIPEVKIETFHLLYNVNVRGPMLLVQAALPYLPHDRSGRIVSVSSISSMAGLTGQCVYAGTKAALEGMSRTWARELSTRATVNCVNPGPVATDMYSGVRGTAFEDDMRPWIMHTPLAQTRSGIDSEQVEKHAVQAGGRPALPEEIAGVIGMLCTADAAWCTGSVVNANGGMMFGT